MSIQSEIDRIKGNIAGAYTAVSDMGGTVPEAQNSDSLEAAVRSIPAGGGMSQEEADLRYLQLAGGALTGPVIVQEPTVDGNPATRGYVDSAIAEAITGAMEASY